MVVPALEEALTASSVWLTVAAKTALQEAECYTATSILLNLPRRYADRRHRHPLASYSEHAVNSVVRVLGHSYRRLGRRNQLIIEIADDSTQAELVCFGREKIKYLLPVGAEICLTGSFGSQYGKIQATQFEFEAHPLRDIAPDQQSRYSRFNKILPIYTLPAAVPQSAYFRFVSDLLLAMRAREGAERAAFTALPRTVRAYLGAPFGIALYHSHLPRNERMVGRARTILARHELLVLQLRLRPARRATQSAPTAAPPPAPPTTAPPVSAPPAPPSTTADIAAVLQQYRVSLPFSLTAGQQQALAVIYADVAAPQPMKRLLQGDVGVGKTLVALLAMLPVIGDGGQVAFMVPTELLARQQFASARRLFATSKIPQQSDSTARQMLIGNDSITTSLLIGSISAKERRAQAERIASGETQLIIGTHALFSNDISFSNLRMIVIDEQHRFGVEQRTALLEKGVAVHQLFMTATPIPRTLALASYAGFDIVIIADQPHGRKAIITKVVAQQNEERVYQAVRSELEHGHQAYFVYPLIEEDERKRGAAARNGRGVVLRSAEKMAAVLQHESFADYTVACIHSRVADQEKEEIMNAFLNGEVQVLVATSVIEVGVDVSNATCMVINNAERFGLAALHQLRGRVGRSDLQSYAFLIYQDAQPLSDDAKSRLKVIYQYTDGFFISEADLFIRGPGELTGTKQSGTSDLKTVRFPQHLDLLQQARHCAITLAEDQAFAPALIASAVVPAPSIASAAVPAAPATNTADPSQYLIELQQFFL